MAAALVRSGGTGGRDYLASPRWPRRSGAQLHWRYSALEPGGVASEPSRVRRGGSYSSDTQALTSSSTSTSGPSCARTAKVSGALTRRATASVVARPGRPRFSRERGSGEPAVGPKRGTGDSPQRVHLPAHRRANAHVEGCCRRSISPAPRSRCRSPRHVAASVQRPLDRQHKFR